jgi:hypothetical protein
MKPDRLDHLIQALFDGLLDDNGREELNALLLGSKEARDRYRRANDFHVTLLRRASAVDHTPEISTIPVHRHWGRRIATVAAVAAIGAGCAFFLNAPDSPRARLVTTVDSSWGGNIRLTANQKLPVSTPLELLRGVAELSYPSGAQVTLEGPCRFQLDKPEAITVLHGRASVHAPPGAQGFRS